DPLWRRIERQSRDRHALDRVGVVLCDFFRLQDQSRYFLETQDSAGRIVHFDFLREPDVSRSPVEVLRLPASETGDRGHLAERSEVRRLLANRRLDRSVDAKPKDMQRLAVRRRVTVRTA